MSTTRETLKHATIYSAASMLGKLAGFIMLPFYAYKLGAEGYGVIGMVDASITLLSSLLAYGGQSAITRVYHEQPEGSKATAVSTGFWLVGGVTAAMVVMGMAASGPISGLLLGDASLNLLFCLALLSFLLDMSGETAGVVLLIRRKSIAYSAISFFRLLCGLTLNVLLIVVLDLGLLGYFLSSSLTSAIVYVVLQHICFRDCGFSYDRDIAREIVRFQTPLIPSALISFASRQSERVILRFAESIEKVGMLEMAYKFPSLLQMLIHAPLMQSWNTERIRIAQRGDIDAPSRIGDMFTLSLYLLLSGALLIALCIGDVLVLLTPEEFWGAKRIAQIECLTVVITSVSYHSSFGYLFRKDSKAWALLTGSISIIKITFSILFISWLGIYGAAYSALCAAITLFVMASLGGQRRYAIRYRNGANLLICVYAASLFIGVEFCSAGLMRFAQTLSDFVQVHFELESLGYKNAVAAGFAMKLPYALDGILRGLICASMILLLPVAHPSLKQWLNAVRIRIGGIQWVR